MKLERISIQGFRCFGPEGVAIWPKAGITTFVGANGSGKTAVFQALARVFGVTPTERSVRRSDFQVSKDEAELKSGAKLSIDVLLCFPELESGEAEASGAVPEFFRQMAVEAPDRPLKARLRLEASWFDDGTPDGNVEQDLRWVHSLDDDFSWDQCRRVQGAERSSIQFVYVPATRDAARQVTAMLRGRIWRAAQWSSEFRSQSSESARRIQEKFEAEGPAQFVSTRLARRWKQVHAADTDATPVLRLVERRFDELVRKAEFAFFPDAQGRERELNDLSDGQRSLFHIALTATALEVEEEALQLPQEQCPFDQERLRTTHLTILAVEEPENSLSPFFLSRIVGQAREIAELRSAQILFSSHSPAILGRVDPEEVRYFRLTRDTREAEVRGLTLPDEDEEASKYVRLAVRAFPELYFARFVILGEGDTERIVIPRVAEAMGISLDSSFVPIVPLGGRFVEHFWALLRDLNIPHATLLDLDLGRRHGGPDRIRSVVERLEEAGVTQGERGISAERLQHLDQNALAPGGSDVAAMEAVRKNGIFFCYPLDLDFSMLCSFPGAYRVPRACGHGPNMERQAIADKKATTLKTGGTPAIYSEDYDEAFAWYPYLFMGRSKPEAHLTALGRIPERELSSNAPAELKALIEHTRNVLGLSETGRGDGAGEA